MEKVLVFRFFSDRLPVLDVQYGQIVDGRFEPFNNVAAELHDDLYALSPFLENTDILATDVVARSRDFGKLLWKIYTCYSSHLIDVEYYPSFVVFKFEFDHESKEENEEAR